jgi:PPM family protein phosphatase
MDANAAKLEVGARSETGYVRDENQDRMTGDVGPFGPFYIVADGMGGHRGGALAAQLAVQELARQIKEAPATESVEQVIQAAFKKANETIYQKGHAGDPEIDGMGTTAVLLLISGRIARLAHVGDSRAYLYRDSVLTQLTKDHTMVQKMVEEGLLKPEDAADHPNASVLERAIGTQQSVEVDISKELPLKDGDAILLCSDGLSGYVTNQEIESALRSPAPSQEITTRLVNLALQKGGRDNVTVQFIQYGPRKEPPPVQAPNPAKPTTATAVVNAGGHSEQGNPRSEARPVEPAKIEKPATITPTKPSFYSFRTVAALILGAAIAALGFYIFLSTRTSELEAANESISKLQKELENTKTANDNAGKELEDLKRQLGPAKQTAKTIEKLQKELQDAKAAHKNATKEAEDLKRQVVLAGQSAKATAEKLQKSETARKNAEKNAEGLKRQVDEKERELQETKKQIQTPASKTTQSKDPEKAAGTEGTTAPGKTSGAETTTGQKDVPQGK